MKWPNTLTVVRHGESAYNILKGLKNADPAYVEFKKAYNSREKDPERARELAEKLVKVGTYILGIGEHDTALTDPGKLQSETTGRNLRLKGKLPDVVIISPYGRTHETFDYMAEGWPELVDVKKVEDERWREQEHGLASLYNDWRIFQVLHPDQDALREMQGPYWYRYPQGENVPDVRERIRSATTSVARDYHEQNVLVVTHHLSILSLRANLERLDARGFIDLDNHNKPINCGVTTYLGNPELGEDGKLVLDTYNEQLY